MSSSGNFRRRTLKALARAGRRIAGRADDRSHLISHLDTVYKTRRPLSPFVKCLRCLVIHQRLAEREQQGRPLQVGLIGAGTFGTQIIAQTCRMQGMRIAAVAELLPDRAVAAFRAGGMSPDKVREASTA